MKKKKIDDPIKIITDLVIGQYVGQYVLNELIKERNKTKAYEKRKSYLINVLWFLALGVLFMGMFLLGFST